MPLRHRAIAILAGLAIGLVPAGAAVAGYETKTRAEYIAEVDPICKRTDQRLSKVFRPYGRALDRGRFDRAARILKRAIKIYAASLGELDAIEPPIEDMRTIDKWLGLERDDVGVTKALARALKREQLRRANRQIKKSRAIEKRIDRVIGDYGFKACN